VIRKKMIIDIISLILDVANQDNRVKGTSTTIMYRALFGQPELREFWNTLIKNDLLKFDLQTRTFKSTEKGVAFLRAYEKMDHHVTKKRASSLLPA
jgi:predicted transcriptional regulator